MKYYDDEDDDATTTRTGGLVPSSNQPHDGSLVRRPSPHIASEDEHVHVPEILRPRFSEHLTPAVARSPQPIPYQPVSAMGHAATASDHALKIATNAVAVKKLSLNLWEFGEGILTKVEQHRLKRDRIKQERFVLSQTAGAQTAIALESLNVEFQRIRHQKIENEAGHRSRMKVLGVDTDYTIKNRRVQTDSLGREGAVESAAKRDAVAHRTVLDVAEHYVICDANHLYHAAAAIWYWGARRRGSSHDQALQATVARLIERMKNDPINLAEASKDMKKWMQMQEEMREEAVTSRLQNDIATERAERERRSAFDLERERLRTEAERERRMTAEVNYDTFAGGDVGEDEN
jgi:hypothetical protein